MVVSLVAMSGVPLGKLFGIDLRLHWSFSLLLAWVGYQGFLDGGPLRAVFLVLLICAVFVCVVLHEMGHSLAARRYGVPTISITLYPIGGVARLGFIPRNPRQELVIALAGPAVNVLIAAALVPLVWFTGIPVLDEAGEPPYDLSAFVVSLMGCNLIMVLFNLIPAFPMDGGRVLRAIIAWNGRYMLATNIAAWLGQLLALGFVVAGSRVIPGFEFRPTLIIIGIFIFLAAASERKAAARAFCPPPPLPVEPPGAIRTLVIGPDDWEVHPR